MEILKEVGVYVEDLNRSGTMVIRDESPIYISNKTSGMELMPIREALDKYKWLRDTYYWKAVSIESDKITKEYMGLDPQGFFLRVHKGAKVKLPCQVALYIGEEKKSQYLHNVVIVEEDAELELITGCLTDPIVKSASHVSVDEQYIGKNAKLIQTMVHSWGEEVQVQPRSGTIVEDKGVYEHRFVVLRSPKKSVSKPNTYLNGQGASAKLTSVVLGSQESEIEVGGDVYLNGEKSSAELIHRGVSNGGQIYQSGLLIGKNTCRAHVDCAGILLKENIGMIESIPGLHAYHPEAMMSHEASIGRVSPEQIEYLQSKGMREHEALTLLVRGFIGSETNGLGKALDDQITSMITLAGHGEAEERVCTA